MFNSVHLTKFPVLDNNFLDLDSIVLMDAVRDICSTGFGLRKIVNIRVRMPLHSVKLCIADSRIVFSDDYINVIKDELNVHNVEIIQTGFDEIVDIKYTLNLRECGKKYGKDLSRMMMLVNNNECSLNGGNLTVAEFVLLPSEFSVLYLPKVGCNSVAKCSSCDIIVILDTEINEELLNEGCARDFVRFIQQQRRTLNLEITQRIDIQVYFVDQNLTKMLDQFVELIKLQVLCNNINYQIIDQNQFNEMNSDNKFICGEISDNMFYILLTNA